MKVSIFFKASLFVIGFLAFFSVSAQVYTYTFSEQKNQLFVPLVNPTISSAIGDDDAEFGIALPFNFHYAGYDYSEIAVGSNGWLRIGSSTNISANLAAENSFLGTPSCDNNLIFPLWDNLNPESGVISYQAQGSAPDRVFIIEWSNIHWSGFGDNSAPLVTFQVHLFEGSNIIQFKYGQINDGLWPTASIGMVGNDANDFVSISPGVASSVSSTSANNEISDSSDLTNTVYSFTPAPNCSGIPTAETINSSSLLYCPSAGSTINFSISKKNIFANLNYQWEQSFDGTNWVSLDSASGGTSPFFTAQNVLDTVYYRCGVGCITSGGISYSDTVKINASIVSCYCQSTAMDADYDNDDIGMVNFITISNGVSTPLTDNNLADKQRSDFTSLVTPPVVVKGLSYPISISQISRDAALNNGHINVFIDFNQDGTFNEDGPEHAFYGETYPNLNITQVLGEIAIPRDAKVGLCGMRIILVTSLGGRPQEKPCDSYGYGETEDYLIEIKDPDACLGQPSAGQTIASVHFGCNQPGNESTANFSLAQSSVALGLLYQWQFSADGNTWMDVVGETNYTLDNYQISSDINIRCKVTCQSSGLFDYSAPTFVGYSILGCYCTSGPDNSVMEQVDIGNVTFAGINNGVATPVLGNPTARNGYSDFTALTPAQVWPGATYPISISQIQSSEDFFSTYATVYIDFNQDGIFDDSTEQVVMKPTLNSTNNVVNSNITIPFTALKGLTRMRVVLYLADNYYYGPCDSYVVGETEDYLINISNSPACSGQPNAGETISSLSFVCDTSPVGVQLSLKNETIASDIVYQWQQSLDGNQWTDIAGETNALANSLPLTASTFFRCKLSCPTSALSSYSDEAKVTSSFLGCYCSSAAENREDQDIGNVSIGSLNNGDATISMNNPYSNNTYSDYRYLAPTPLQIGNIIPVSITEIEEYDLGSFYASYIHVYIDYNQDGVYDETKELAFSGNTTSDNNISVGSLSIPLDAKIGNTGMRVTLQDGWERAQGYQACGTFDWGETEDYIVDILPAADCSNNINGGNVVSDISFICSTNATATLTLINSTIASGITYQWQQSSDGISWSNAPGNSTTFSYQLQNATNSILYRAELKCNGSNAEYSVPLRLNVSSKNCYCDSEPGDNDESDIGNVTIDGILDNGIIPYTLDVTQFNLTAVNKYSDFTYMPNINLLPGHNYNMTVTQMDRVYFTPSTINAYIDFNQNGNFDLPNELVFTGITSEVSSPFVQGNINIPSNVILGKTRLRIVLEDEPWDPSVPKLDEPCGIYGNGETEDYTVTIGVVTETKLDDSNFQLYPNPTDKIINLKLDASQSLKQISIYTVMGNLIEERQTNMNELEIDLNNYPTGVYLLQVKSNSGLKVLKFVKR